MRTHRFTTDHATAPRWAGFAKLSARAALLIAVLLACAHQAAAQGGITFSLANLETTSGGVSFDVLAQADGSRLGDTQVYLEYNEATFGTRINDGARISAAVGPALASAYGEPIINDNADARVSLTAPFLGDATEGVPLGDEPLVLMHVTIEPVSDDESGQIAFYEPLMEGQQYTSDLATAFPSVDAGGVLDVDVSGLLSPTLLATTSGAGAVQLDWTAGPRAADFEVEHAEGSTDTFRKVASIEKADGTDRVAHTIDELDIGTHRFRIRKVDASGKAVYSEVVEVKVEMAEQFALDPVYPNPFNPQATVRFAVKESQNVRIDLYNSLGQRVHVLFEGKPTASTYHEVKLDGSALAGGVYFVRLQGESFASTQRVTLLK